MKIFLSLFLLIVPFVMTEAAFSQTLMIKLKVTDSRYELMDSWLLSRTYPSIMNTSDAKELKWKLLDAEYNLIKEGWIKDPQKINGALLEEIREDRHEAVHEESSHEKQKHGTEVAGGKIYRHQGAHRVDSADVIIRVPYDARIKILQIERHPDIAIASNVTSSTASQKPVPMEKAEFQISPRKAKTQ